jgi:hypothetical protein
MEGVERPYTIERKCSNFKDHYKIEQLSFFKLGAENYGTNLTPRFCSWD